MTTSRAPLLVPLAALLLAPAPVHAADPPGPAASAARAPPAFEFETFQLVLLMRPPDWKPIPDAEAEAIQKAHIGHLEKMGASGKMVIAGPFGNQRDPAYRGACLYRVATPEEARALAEQDPAVKAGRLRVEVMTWAVGKGYMTFPRAPPVEPERSTP